jgi:hypothetical protein
MTFPKTIVLLTFLFCLPAAAEDTAALEARLNDRAELRSEN